MMETKEEAPVMLPEYMQWVIKQLKADKKHAAVHTYQSTLNSFILFAKEEAEEEAKEKATKEKVTGEEAKKEEAVGAAPDLTAAPDLAVTPNLAVTPDLAADAVFTPGKMKSYENWLRQRGVKWNTVSTYMRTIKATYNRLYEPGMAGYNPKLFENVYTKVDSLIKRAITEEQINILMATDFETLPEELRSVLAYFLLMFYFRGVPLIDLAYMLKQDLNGNIIAYCRHKTGKLITLRIPKEAAPLFEACRDKTRSPYLFPIFAGNVPKDDAELYAYYQRALRRFNKKAARLAALLLPGFKLSSYTPRHTWATLARNHGIDPSVISKILGHSSLRVTETYFKPYEDEKADMANDSLIASITKGRKIAGYKPGNAPLSIF